MSNYLRKALGLRHRSHLAVEDIDTPLSAETPAEGEETVLMKGPLAGNYSDALDVAFSKENPPETPATGDPSAAPEPAAETGENVDPAAVVPTPGTELEPTETVVIPEIQQVVLESQAIDAGVVAALQAAAVDEEPTDGTQFTTLYAIDESQIKPENVVEVTQLLSQAEDPETVSVLIDDVLPADPNVEVTDVTAAATQQMVIGLESIVTAMGGKVYHKFGDYVAARKATTAK